MTPTRPVSQTYIYWESLSMLLLQRDHADAIFLDISWLKTSFKLFLVTDYLLVQGSSDIS